jgi:hypothetical protein
MFSYEENLLYRTIVPRHTAYFNLFTTENM